MQLLFDFPFDLPLHLAADVVAAVDVVVVALLSRVVLVHRSSAALTRIRSAGSLFLSRSLLACATCTVSFFFLSLSLLVCGSWLALVPYVCHVVYILLSNWFREASTRILFYFRL